jgi:hypothetical protein
MSSVTGNDSVGPEEVLAAATDLEVLQENERHFVASVPLHHRDSSSVRGHVVHLQQRQTERTSNLRELLLLYTQSVANSLEGRPDPSAASLRHWDGTSGNGTNQDSLLSQQHSAHPDSMSGHSGVTHSAREP